MKERLDGPFGVARPLWAVMVFSLALLCGVYGIIDTGAGRMAVGAGALLGAVTLVIYGAIEVMRSWPETFGWWGGLMGDDEACRSNLRKVVAVAMIGGVGLVGVALAFLPLDAGVVVKDRFGFFLGSSVLFMLGFIVARIWWPELLGSEEEKRKRAQKNKAEKAAELEELRHERVMAEEQTRVAQARAQQARSEAEEQRQVDKASGQQREPPEFDDFGRDDDEGPKPRA